MHKRETRLGGRKEMDKYDERHNGTHPAAAGAQPDPGQEDKYGDHRPRTAQDHPAQESAEGQDDPGLGDRIGVTVRDSPDSMGDHLHIAGGTDLRGGEEDARTSF